jgi:hypothetical protein
MKLVAYHGKPATVGLAQIFTEKSRGMDHPGMLAIPFIVEALTGQS